MANLVPTSANAFIEQQLNERLVGLEQAFDSDILTMVGDLIEGVDDLIRNLKEWLVRYKFKNWTATESRHLPVTLEMRQERAESIARELNNTDRWHSHGYGISMEVLRKDLNLRIDDLDSNPERHERVKQYHGLLSD